MNDRQLRELVREIVTRRLAERGVAPDPAVTERPETTIQVGPSGLGAHSSHQVYFTLVNTGDACVVEPDVPCTHCHYCKSHGH